MIKCKVCGSTEFYIYEGILICKICQIADQIEGCDD